MEASQTQAPNLVEVVKNYLLSIVEEVPGIKALVLDGETTRIVSLACQKSVLLSHEVFLIETIENFSGKQFPYMKAICLLRTTEDNKKLLCQLIKNSTFAEFYLYFTSIPYSMSSQSLMQEIAQSDEHSLVKCVQVWPS